MKKNINTKDIKYLLIVMMAFFISPLIVKGNNLLILQSCSEILGKNLSDLLEYVYKIIRIATPILVVLLITVDLTKAVMAGEEKNIKEAQSAAIKRIIIGVIIMLLPTIVKLLLWLVGRTSTSCTFG